MRAAEQERVDRRAGGYPQDRVTGPITPAEERGEGVRDRSIGSRSGQDSGLDQRDERGGRVLMDLDRRVLILDRREIRVRPDGRGGRDDPDAPVAGGQRGGRRTRPDDAEDRQVVAPPERAEADRRRGIASDDDGLDVALDESVQRLGGERQDLLVRADTVRGAGIVPEVDR